MTTTRNTGGGPSRKPPSASGSQSAVGPSGGKPSSMQADAGHSSRNRSSEMRRAPQNSAGPSGRSAEHSGGRRVSPSPQRSGRPAPSGHRSPAQQRSSRVSPPENRRNYRQRPSRSPQTPPPSTNREFSGVQVRIPTPQPSSFPMERFEVTMRQDTDHRGERNVVTRHVGVNEAFRGPERILDLSEMKDLKHLTVGIRCADAPLKPTEVHVQRRPAYTRGFHDDFNLNGSRISYNSMELAPDDFHRHYKHSWEGTAPMFERPEIKEGILDRMKREKDMGSGPLKGSVPDVKPFQQRVVAVIREGFPHPGHERRSRSRDRRSHGDSRDRYRGGHSPRYESRRYDDLRQDLDRRRSGRSRSRSRDREYYRERHHSRRSPSYRDERERERRRYEERERHHDYRRHEERRHEERRHYDEHRRHDGRYEERRHEDRHRSPRDRHRERSYHHSPSRDGYRDSHHSRPPSSVPHPGSVVPQHGSIPPFPNIDPEFVPRGRAYFEHDNRETYMGRGRGFPPGFPPARGFPPRGAFRGGPFRGRGGTFLPPGPFPPCPPFIPRGALRGRGHLPRTAIRRSPDWKHDKFEESNKDPQHPTSTTNN